MTASIKKGQDLVAENTKKIEKLRNTAI